MISFQKFFCFLFLFFYLETYASMDCMDTFQNKAREEIVADLPTVIDHTILNPDANTVEVIDFARDTIEFNFHSICVNSCNVLLVKKYFEGQIALHKNLEKHPPRITSVIGFPLGAASTRAKIEEAIQAQKDGATDLDMVINLGRLKDGDYKEVESDISSIVKSVNIPVKVILETSLLTEGEKKIAAKLAEKSGAAYVKTSTGFSTGGATAADIRILKNALENPKTRIKASGGIRTVDQAIEMLQAGANLLGTSRSIELVTID